MGRHTLVKQRTMYAPAHFEAKQFGALGGTVSLTMAGLACLGCVLGVPIVAQSLPPDLFAAPSPAPASPWAQRPAAGLFPGSGASLRYSLGLDPVFGGTRLDAGVASDRDVLKAALSEPLSLTLPAPVGRWVSGRWVPGDSVRRPPCPSPVLDPVGWRRWWALWYPGHVPPVPPTVPTAPPVTAPAAPPAVTPAPPAVVPVVSVTTPVEAASSPPAAEEPAQTPPDTTPIVDVGPVQVDPPSVDLPVVDVPPVTVDLPILPPVEVDLPPIDVPVLDLPPVELPPADLSPVTDPVTDVLPTPVGDTVDDVVSVLSAPDVTQPAVPFNSAGANESNGATTGATETLVQSAAPLTTKVAVTPHSTSGNGKSYVGKHRAEDRDRGVRAGNHDRRSDRESRGADSGRVHRDHASDSDGHKDHRDNGGKHRSDRVKSESKSESKSHDSHSNSHDGGRGRGGRHGR